MALQMAIARAIVSAALVLTDLQDTLADPGYGQTVLILAPPN
jgi:hypothetical protein